MLELSDTGAWRPRIVPTVAETGEGVDELWVAVGAHRRHLVETGELAELRRARLVEEVRAEVVNTVRRRVRRRMDDATWQRTIDLVESREIDPWTAARRIADLAAPG
jgi:LAO/AO transport system kinase